MVSTPNAPEGLFEEIEKEPESKCLYTRLFLPYHVGLGTIYTQEEIDKAKDSPSFEREYNLQYIGQMGNVFSTESIQNAMALGLRMEEIRNGNIPLDTIKMAGIDAGFSTSAFAIVVVQMTYNKLEVLFAEEFKKPDIGDMIEKILDINSKYGLHKIIIDSANVPVIRALKKMLEEPMDYNEHIARIKRQKLGDPILHMKVVPVSFNSEGKEMLVHTKLMLDKRKVGIHPEKFSKLIIALRTAVAREMKLNKQHTAHDDILDAFRLSIKNYLLPQEWG